DVQHRIGPMLFEQRSDERTVADVAVHERVVRIARDREQRVEITRVRKLVEVDDARVAAHDQSPYQATTNETGSTSYEKRSHRSGRVANLADSLQSGFASKLLRATATLTEWRSFAKRKTTLHPIERAVPAHKALDGFVLREAQLVV